MSTAQREFPGKWAKNQIQENWEMETETEFGKQWDYSENKSILSNAIELILFGRNKYADIVPRCKNLFVLLF